jgi:hypothetical protein
MFRMMELLVMGPNPLGEMGPNPSGVAATARLTGTGPSIEHAGIGEYCCGDAFASGESIRQLKRRLVKRLSDKGMKDLADCIKGDTEVYYLELPFVLMPVG